MKMSKKMILILIILLGVGFASITTTLIIRGNVGVTTNEEDYDVRFTKAILDNENKTSTIISNDGKSINFNTKELKRIGDNSVLEFTVTNKSTMYDANISLNCNLVDTSYYSITRDIPEVVSARSKETGSITITMIKNATEDIDEQLSCEIVSNAASRTTRVAPSASDEVTERRVEYNYGENGGTTTTAESEYLTTGDEIDLTPTATKAGYEFVGWNTNKNAKTALSSLTMPASGDLELYAIFKKTVKATFTYRGENITDKSIEEAECTMYNDDATCEIELPTIITSNNYESLGWQENSNSREEGITGKANINENKTYYSLIRKTYTVSYEKESNVEEVGKTSQTCNIYNEENTCQISLPTITGKTGYSEDGWYIEEVKVGNSGDNYNVGSNITLTAKANANIYKVTLDNKSATTTGTEEIYYQYNETKTINGETCNYYTNRTLTTCLRSITIPTKTGYTFLGYYTENGGAGTKYINDSGSIINDLYKTVGDKTLKAKYSPISYSISYDLDGGNVTSQNPTSYTIESNDITLNNPIKEGYSFAGWTGSNGEVPEASIKINQGSIGNKSYRANWTDATKPRCSWSELPTLQTNGTNTAILTCIDNETGVVSKNLSKNDFTATENGEVTGVSTGVEVTKGYRYTVTLKGLSVGNFTVSLKSGVISDNIGNTNDIATSGNITVNGLTYTATFTSGSNAEFLGSTAKSCTTTGSNMSCSIVLPTITPAEGYSEEGWFLGNTKVGNSGDSYTISGNVDLTTKATINSYTATFNGNGGTNGDSITKNYGEALGTLPTSTRSGYTFTGWFSEQAGGSEISSSTTMPLNGKTYYAHWLKNAEIPTTSYCENLTYNGEGQTITKTAGEGYTFSGNTGKINADSYTVTATLTSGYIWSDGTTSTKTITCSIAKKEVTITADNKSMNYGGSAPTYTYTLTGAIGSEAAVSGTASYTVKNSGGTAVTVNSSLGAGSYTITPSGLTAGSNYTIKEYKNGTLTVSKVDATCPTLTAYSAAYDAKSHTITVSGGNGGTIQYRSSTTGTWSTTKPTRTDAGETAVYVQVEGDTNHNTKDCGNKKITVTPKTLTIPSSPEDKTYNGSSQSSGITCPSGSTTGGTTSATNADTYSQTCTLNSTTNYKWNDDTTSAKSITWKIGRATVAEPSCTARTYNGSSQTMLEAHTSGAYTNEAITGTNAGDYSKTLTLNSNYKWSSGSNVESNRTKTCSISKAKAVAPTLSDVTVTYDGERHYIASTGGTSGLTVKYAYRTCTSGTCGSWSSYGTSADYSSSIDVGIWDIKAITSGNSNYNDSDESNVARLTINKRATTCTSGSSSRAYNGSALTDSTGSCTNLVSGHTATFSNSGTITMPGSTANTLNSVTIKSGTTNMNSNYIITTANGTLTVTGNTYTINFTKGENVTSIGSTSLSCTTGGSSCSITLPTISPASGYVEDGWYSGTTNVGKSNTSYTLTSSNTGTTLTAKAASLENSNITKVMKYSTDASDRCITGDESTCEEITHKKTNTYEAGTIVKYKVNSSTTRTFFVMHDDGNTLTMQDRENLLNATKWYSSSDNNSHGPITALTALESATSSWSNVEDQTYTMGTTEFGWDTHKNAYTGCSKTGCDRNSNYGYTLGTRTAKARMITMQEVLDLGCTNSNQSCPIWMNNYLGDATSYGGTNTGKDYGYWTMSAYSSSSRYAWRVSSDGSVSYSYTTDTSNGVRPVVVVKK